MDDKPHISMVRNIAESLCSQPEQIELEDSIDERGVLIKLFVSKDDLPRIIGKGGDTAKAVRQLLRALGAKNNARYSFKVDQKPYSVGP